MRAVAIIVAGIGLVVASLRPSPAAAQEAVDAQWARQFVGSWALTLQTPDGEVPTEVTVREEAGQVTVQLGRGGQQGRPITELRRAGDALVAAYEIRYQGMPLPATLHLKREGEGLHTEWVFADGLYQTSARANRK